MICEKKRFQVCLNYLPYVTISDTMSAVENITIMLRKYSRGPPRLLSFSCKLDARRKSMLHCGCSFARKMAQALISAGINIEDEPIQASVTKQQNAQLTTSNGNSKRGPTHSGAVVVQSSRAKCAP